MPRKKRNHNAPFFRNANGWWYAQLTVNGKRVQKKLIQGFENSEEAERLYHAEKAKPREAPAPVILTVASPYATQIIDDYLTWCKQRKAKATYDWYFGFLQDFAASIDKYLSVDQLKPAAVDAWTFKHPDWAPTTVRDAILTVQRAYRWAEKHHGIPSPLHGMEKPAAEAREVFITLQQFQLVLSLTPNADFRDLLHFLWETGARPQEAFRATSAHFNGRTIVFQKKQAKGKKRPRTIYLNDKALAIVQRRIAAQGDGFIFRHCQGGRWNKNSVNVRFRRLQVKLVKRGCPIPGLCAYALRHSFATLALLRGVNPVSLSHLMGHSDLKMITKVYAHLAENEEHLLDELRKATGTDS